MWSAVVATSTIVAASTMADTSASATMPGSSGGDLAGAKLPGGGNIDSCDIPANSPPRWGTLVSGPFRAAVQGSEGAQSRWFAEQFRTPPPVAQASLLVKGGRSDNSPHHASPS